MNRVLIAIALTAIICMVQAGSTAETPGGTSATKGRETRVTVDAGKTGAPISKYIYGQFVEHLGRCIYGGIWAEMLEDRKFFYAVEAKESPWQIVGGKNAVEMVTEQAYVGDHMPRVHPGGTTAGIAQDGLGLLAGQRYTGRIALAGSEDAGPVTAHLVWGRRKADRQTITIPRIDTDFAAYPLAFTAGASTDDARLEIVAGGTGHVDIGTVSLMPASNVHGMRADTLALLRELNAPVYRWPGGNFVSGYNWRDGIGECDRRPPRKNPAWKGIEHNDFGIDEFMVFCTELGTEPYIAVNSGLGAVEEAAAELEYVNGGPDTAMGTRRAANGHPEPYGVRWWGIGNEMYGNWQLGHISLEEYVQKHNAFAEAMRAVDPGIHLVGVGATGNWSETMLAECAGHMEYLSEHFYTGESRGLLKHVYSPRSIIRKKVEAHRKYHAELPALAGKSIPICMDEWNYWYGDHRYGELGVRYYLKDALGVAAALHEYFRNSDVIHMANYAQTVNVIGCIKTSKTAAGFATTGLPLALYRREFGTIPVAIEAGPGPLDVMAAWTEDRSALTIGIVNPTRETQTLPLAVHGAALTGAGTRWVISGPDPMAYNNPGEAPAVTTQQETVRGVGNALEAPAFSVSLYRLDAH